MTRSELYGYLADPQRLGPATLEPIRQLQASYPYCGAFAFLYLYNLATTQDIRYPAELRRLAPLLQDSSLLFRLVEGDQLSGQPEQEPEPAKREDSFDLIDHFLVIARASGEDLPESLHFDGHSDRSEYFTSADLEAEEETSLPPLIPTSAEPTPLPSPTTTPAGETAPSEPATDRLLSETLSKIYIQQGHYDKALRIIRSLSLNYPEKSRFFVHQIRFLERLISNNKSTK